MHSKDFQFKFVAQLQQHPHVPENALVRLVLLIVFAPEVLIEQFDVATDEEHVLVLAFGHDGLVLARLIDREFVLEPDGDLTHLEQVGQLGGPGVEDGGHLLVLGGVELVRGAHLHHLHLHCKILLQVFRDVFHFTLEKELEFLLDVGSFDFVFLLAFLRLLIRLSLPMEECVNCVQDVSSGWRVHFEECFLQLILELLTFNKHSLDGLH